ncbi:hypothetical protein [Bowmanella yangjiangensis]|uniref:Uncharacterized protein n=1 Tax=Bowmanella yangjiangensis TaxID=2811230 RepID=A0ABS3D2I4_9ALTE|nr:hypothetical protein [Bowmanella yangjiangensis]MBN7822586.1 hypothetical protein [Bowmanella yangjiangensis]
MSLERLIAALGDKLSGNVPYVALKADQPTGRHPMNLFDIEEQTEHYLTLKVGEEKHRGMLTGILGGIGGGAFIFMGLLEIYYGRPWESIGTFLTAIPILVLPFLWETLRPLPLPILFNRRTREVYLEQDGVLYHCPWDEIAAVAYEFRLVGPYTGATRSAALEVLMHQYQRPERQVLVSLGVPMGKDLDMQLCFWEYLRAYMNNGPWFDERGNHSESDAFVKSQLAIKFKLSEQLGEHWRDLKKRRKESDGRNYLQLSDVFLLFGGVLEYPVGVIGEYTYKVASRRSRANWPEVVRERLDPNGPTERLIDVERNSGSLEL